MLFFSSQDDGKVVKVKAGQYFTVELNSNPGTGYKWNWRTKPDPVLIKLEKQFHRPRTSKPQLVGGGGIDTWIFQALTAGSTVLELEYRRLWEEKPPLNRFIMNITIVNNK